MLGRYRAAFPFVEGIAKALAYWRAGGTIDTSWEAHIDLLGPQADFQLSPSQEPLHAAPAQESATTLLSHSRCRNP
jgi:ADP-glucose pyrophosphorylase